MTCPLRAAFAGVTVLVAWALLASSVCAQVPDAKQLYERGHDLYNRGDRNGSLAALTQAIAADPTYADAYYSRCIVRYELNMIREAVEDCTRVLQINPGYGDAYYLRGLIRSQRMGDLRGSILDFDAAIRIDPKYWAAYVKRGNARTQLADQKTAIADFTKAIDLAQAVGGGSLFAEAYYGRCVARYELDLIPEALEDCTRAFQISPDYAAAYYLRGLIRSQRIGDLRGSLLDFDAAIRNDPNYSAAYLKRGNAHSRLGDTQAAIADYTKAIGIDGDVDAYFNRGVTRYQTGSSEAALADLRMAAELYRKQGDEQAYKRVQDAIESVRKKQ
jgi:tetratricopeptide (TPR) repeat protein